MSQPPGCGWDPDMVGSVLPQYHPESCAAAHGHVPAHAHFGEDRPGPTIGTVGLCIGCLEAPADLLQALSKSVQESGRDDA